MNVKATLIAAAIGTLFSAAAFAQQGTVQRDVNQQNRIEQGLQNGSLTTKEASTLEREESRVDKNQARDLRNGNLSATEKARLQKEQNRVSADINRKENNAATGNPNSASSKRMQADVQRNANQESRIEQGVKSGSLTNHEAAKLEAGQARDDRKEARAGANGRVTVAEQARIQRSENHQSKRIFKQKHDAQVRS